MKVRGRNDILEVFCNDVVGMPTDTWFIEKWTPVIIELLASIDNKTLMTIMMRLNNDRNEWRD